MEEKFDIIPNINYNIYNALNLACEDLGERYLETGFNPFGDNFVLNEEYITDNLLNCKNAPEIKCPEFIEKGEKASIQAFECSLENCTALLAETESKLNSPDLTPEAKAKLQKIIIYLKMRIELLIIFTQKQKKAKNKFNQYKKLLSLNYTYGDILEDSYEESFDLHLIANRIFATELESVQENKSSVIEQAKQIIADNIKKQELSEQKNTEKPQEEINKYQQALNEIKAEKQNANQNIEKPQSTLKNFDDFSR